MTWLGVERSAYPKRTGLRDFGLVDLPFPLRKVSVNPVATLRSRTVGGATGYELERGVSVFPSVGDPVLLPTAEQLRAIVESQGPNRRVRIGTSPLASDAAVSVDPDKLFGRHLAVLGNTGSGKSCSVAGLIRWSLSAASAAASAGHVRGRPVSPNARFVVLDPNGEYLTTFRDMPGSVRVFRAPVLGHDPASEGALPLSVPAWMWNSQEWSAFTQAAPGVQRPLLLRGLRDLRSGSAVSDGAEVRLALAIRSYRAWLDKILATGPANYGGELRGRMECGHFLQRLADDAAAGAAELIGEPAVKLSDVAAAASALAKDKESPSRTGQIYFDSFGERELLQVRAALDAAVEQLPEVEQRFGTSEDAPAAFAVDALAGYLELVSKTPDFSQNAQHVPALLARIKTMLSDPRLAPIVNPDHQPAFAEWLDDYVGRDGATNGQIAVVDLSLIPSDVLHVAIAVIARLVFEASQRYRKLTGRELPTTLVLEEAHTFIRRGDREGPPDAAGQLCRETFERIAREGRKFGVGLVLSSQRPSELSATVLAQCNTFLLHRIVNDRDQELVGRLVPDNLGALLRELPNLPSRQAILLGWATPIPVLVEIDELPPDHRPRSADPRFWDVWTGEEERAIDWTGVADDWVGGAANAPPAPAAGTTDL